MVVVARQLPRLGLPAGTVASAAVVVVVVVVDADEAVPVVEEMLDVLVVSEVPVVAEPYSV